MSGNIPEISISKVLRFNAAGIPDCELFEISAIIDSTDEISPLGSIRLEDASDLVALYNSLGTYILMNGLDNHVDVKEKGESEYE